MIQWEKVLRVLPEVKKPLTKHLSFNTKLKWTGMILVMYFVLSHIPLYGLGQNALSQFEHLAIILGTRFDSIIALGIGPIVTASIIIQLLMGSGILKMDTNTHEGRMRFQGMQKAMIILFILFEASVYVLMGGLAPDPALVGTSAYLFFQIALMIQLALGGFLIMMMDEVVSKWGFGTGISLFIAAGVSAQVFVRAFNPMKEGAEYSAGAVLQIVQALRAGDTVTTAVAIVTILATVVVFLLCVYAQAMKVEIPLSFGRVRGYGMRWPLKFMYTSNIPVILIASLLATVQLWARLLQNWGHPILGTFQGNTPVSGLVALIDSPQIVDALIKGNATWSMGWQTLVYIGIMMGGAVLFSVMWVKTSNMDARAQAEQILKSGLQIPGFRRDPRVMETILNRYIPALTVMGGALVGLLASTADLLGALSRGTGILLTVMIIYQLYESIAKQHAYDMHPALRKMMAPE